MSAQLKARFVRVMLEAERQRPGAVAVFEDALDAGLAGPDMLSAVVGGISTLRRRPRDRR